MEGHTDRMVSRTIRPREEQYPGRKAMGIEVQGRRKRGRPKGRWLDSVMIRAGLETN